MIGEKIKILPILTEQEYHQSLDVGKQYKFLQSDDFAKLKHTLDGAIKDRVKQGIGLHTRQYERNCYRK